MERFGFGALFEIDVRRGVAGLHRAERARHTLERGFTKMAIGLSQTTRGIEQVAMGALMGIQRVGVAATAGLVLSGRGYLKFEDAIAELGTVLDEGQKGAQGMRAEIEQLAIWSGKGGVEIAKAVALARGSGIQGAKALGFVREAAKGAVASYADLTEMVRAGTTVLNAYGKELFAQGEPAEKMAAINDVLKISVLEGAQTMQEMAQHLGLVASPAAIAGADFREVAAMIATLSLAGQGGSKSMINLGQAMRQFTNPAEGAVDLAAKFGFALNRQTLRTYGLVGALRKLTVAVEGDEEAIAKILGTEVRAARAFAALAMQTKKYDEILGRIRYGTGAADKAFEEITDTINQKVRRAWVSLQLGIARVGKAFFDVFGADITGPLIRIGDHLGMIEGRARGFFESMRRGFVALDLEGHFRRFQAAAGRALDFLGQRFGLTTQETRDMALAVGALVLAAAPLAAVLAPILIATGGLVTTFLSVIPLTQGIVTLFHGLALPLSSVAGFAGKLVAKFGLFTGLLGPLALVAAFIKGLIGNVFGMRDAFMYALKPVISILKSVFLPIWEALELIFDVVSDLIINSLANSFVIFGVVLRPVGWALELLSYGLRVVIKSLRMIWEWLTGRLFKAMERFRAAIMGMGDTIETFFSGTKTELAALGVDAVRTAGIMTDAFRKMQTDIQMARFEAMHPGVSRAYIEGAERFVTEYVTQENLSKGIKAVTASTVASVIFPGLAGLLDRLLIANVQVTGEVKNKVCVDGRDLNVAVSTAQLELTQRSGAKTTPWQSRMVRTYGGGIAHHP